MQFDMEEPIPYDFIEKMIIARSVEVKNVIFR